MPPPQLAVVLVGEDRLLALVAGELDLQSELLGYGVLVAALAQQGVDGLQLGPALLPGYLWEVGGRLHPQTRRELDLDPVTADLCVWCVCLWGEGGVYVCVCVCLWGGGRCLCVCECVFVCVCVCGEVLCVCVFVCGGNIYVCVFGVSVCVCGLGVGWRCVSV